MSDPPVCDGGVDDTHEHYRSVPSKAPVRSSQTRVPTSEEVAQMEKQIMAQEQAYNDKAIHAFHLVNAEVQRGTASIKDADAAYNASMQESEEQCVPICAGNVTWRFVGNRTGHDPSVREPFTVWHIRSADTGDDMSLHEAQVAWHFGGINIDGLPIEETSAVVVASVAVTSAAAAARK